MYLKFLFFVFTIVFNNELKADAPGEPPKKWPCDQVYNPKINLTAIWQGPDISEYRKWWKDDDVIEVVNKLSDPVLTEEDGIKVINEFAKKYTFFGLIKKSSQKDKLLNVFAGLYEKALQRRNKQYLGIIKFVEKQDIVRNEIGAASKELRGLRKSGVDPKNPKFLDAEAKLKWNTRVFDQRTRLTEFMCEEPVYGEQRIGYQARQILTFIN